MRDRQEFVMWATAQMIQAKPDDDQRKGHVKACRATAEALADELGLVASPTLPTDASAQQELGRQDAELRRRAQRILDLEAEVAKLEGQLEQATAPAASKARGR